MPPTAAAIIFLFSLALAVAAPQGARPEEKSSPKELVLRLAVHVQKSAEGERLTFNIEETPDETEAIRPKVSPLLSFGGAFLPRQRPEEPKPSAPVRRTIQSSAIPQQFFSEHDFTHRKDSFPQQPHEHDSRHYHDKLSAGERGTIEDAVPRRDSIPKKTTISGVRNGALTPEKQKQEQKFVTTELRQPTVMTNMGPQKLEFKISLGSSKNEQPRNSSHGGFVSNPFIVNRPSMTEPKRNSGLQFNNSQRTVVMNSEGTIKPFRFVSYTEAPEPVKIHQETYHNVASDTREPESVIFGPTKTWKPVQNHQEPSVTMTPKRHSDLQGNNFQRTVVMNPTATVKPSRIVSYTEAPEPGQNHQGTYHNVGFPTRGPVRFGPSIILSSQMDPTVHFPTENPPEPINQDHLHPVQVDIGHQWSENSQQRDVTNIPHPIQFQMDPTSKPYPVHVPTENPPKPGNQDHSHPVQVEFGHQWSENTQQRDITDKPHPIQVLMTNPPSTKTPQYPRPMQVNFNHQWPESTTDSPNFHPTSKPFPVQVPTTNLPPKINSVYPNPVQVGFGHQFTTEQPVAITEVPKKVTTGYFEPSTTDNGFSTSSSVEEEDSSEEDNTVNKAVADLGFGVLTSRCASFAPGLVSDGAGGCTKPANRIRKKHFQGGYKKKGDNEIQSGVKDKDDIGVINLHDL